MLFFRRQRRPHRTHPRAVGIRRAAALVGFGVSLVLETAQLWLPMRYPSVDDLVLNTLGCVLGLLLARLGLATTEASGLVKSQRR